MSEGRKKKQTAGEANKKKKEKKTEKRWFLGKSQAKVRRTM